MKVLIISASAGAGHRKAAEALYNSFNRAKIQAQKIDALDYTNPLFKSAYPSVYIFLVRFAPFLWGMIFHFLNIAILKPVINPVRYFFNYINGRPLIKYVLKEQPDVVICVHFFSAQLISRLKAAGRFKGYVVCGVTDFGVHQFWINQGTDYYLVASEMTKTELIAKGVPSDKILVTGIPVEEKFLEPAAKDELRKKLGVAEDTFTILVASGGFGVGPIKKIVQNLDQMNQSLQVLVICGENDRLREFFAGQSFKKTVRVFGYVNNMHEFMAASDIIITKSGGLTVSESLVKALPMIIIRPIPGQEMRNAQVVTKYKAGIKIDDASDVTKQIELLLKDNRQELMAMKKNAQKLGKGESADKICQWVIQNLS